VWKDNIIRLGQSAEYGRMVDSLNRDRVRLAQGGTFPRYPNWETMREMDRCVSLPVRASYLDVERFNRQQTERDLGEGPHRVVLSNAGGNPNSLPAANHPNYEGEVRRLREKGQKGRGKGSEPPWRRPQERSSSSGYDQRNADWNNYNAAAMRNEPGSSSGHQSDWYYSRAGWVDRNERSRPTEGSWEDLSQNNDRW
jgi:hypothetical protein